MTVSPEVVAPCALDGENAEQCWKLSEEMVEKFEY
jgi:hypothetical protein